MAPSAQRVRKTLGRYHHGDLREALVVAAERLIASSGQVDVSLRDVAKVAGVSHAAAYRHFDSKAAVLAEVARRGFRALTASLEVAVARAERRDARTRLIEAGVAYVRFAVDAPGSFRVMFHPLVKPFTAHSGLPEAAGAALAVLEGLVTAWAGGQAAPVVVMAAWSALHGHATLLLDEQLRGPFGVGVERSAHSTRAVMSWLFPPRGALLPKA